MASETLTASELSASESAKALLEQDATSGTSAAGDDVDANSYADDVEVGDDVEVNAEVRDDGVDDVAVVDVDVDGIDKTSYKTWHEGVKFVAIDTKTTGFSESDRIVEFAAVTFIDGEIIDQYETLIKVHRDPGPVHVHGITPMMLEAAPLYSGVAADIASRLDGAVLVGHNLNFDVRMLKQEMKRLEDAIFKPGKGVCTYLLTKQKLSLAAEAVGEIKPNQTALQDARIVVSLMLKHADGIIGRGGITVYGSVPEPAVCRVKQKSIGVMTHRSQSPKLRGKLHDMAALVDWAGIDDNSQALGRREAAYLETLDACLDDEGLTVKERVWLDSAGDALNLSESRRRTLHQRYYELIINQITEDGTVSHDDKDLSKRIADALLVQDVLSFEETDDLSTHPLRPGATVCFVGVAVLGKRRLSLHKLEMLATEMGLVVVPSVTEKGCQVLVAADVKSNSVQVSKAKHYNIPVVSIEDFLGFAFAM